MFIGQVFNSDSPYYRWEIQKDGIRHQNNTYSYEDISEIELYTDTSIVLTLRNTNKVRLWFTPYDKEDMLALIQSVSNQKEPKGQTAIDSISKVANEKDRAASDHLISISDVIVTTADLKQDYDVISPVFFQTSNKTTVFGSRWQSLVKKHSDRLQQASIGYEGTIGDALHSLFVNTPGNSEFHKAFFIGVGELQEMALKIGADAIVGVKIDFDLDTAGFQYFYFQMYGTAVKLK